jgi:predicted DNA-binding protein with PD1-like motif
MGSDGASSGTFRAVRLMPGADLIDGLRAMQVSSGAEAMAIVTCVGSVTRAMLRHADRAEGTLYEGRFEIVSLVGSVDSAHQHLHMSIADGEGRVFGGHLLAGSRVHTTAEIVALALPEVIFRRAPCAESGYDELTITTR